MIKNRPIQVEKVLLKALREDAAREDVTTQSIIPKNLKVKAILLAKQDLVLCGMAAVEAAIRALDPRAKFRVRFAEGKRVGKGKVIAEIQGRARAILSAERVALNLLQHLSGIATLTAKFVERLRGTGAKLLDTRKTLPGLRALERYAVGVGGGHNHRFDLKSAVMVKDNHVAVLGSVKAALERLQGRRLRIPVIFEVRTLKELQAVLEAGVRHILLDNMTTAQLKQAVRMAKGGRAKLDASGGIDLKRVREVAKTGVDYISVGALTHSAGAVDISLEIQAVL